MRPGAAGLLPAPATAALATLFAACAGDTPLSPADAVFSYTITVVGKVPVPVSPPAYSRNGPLRADLIADAAGAM